MADEGPTVEIQNDAWFAAGRRIGEQAREIAELRAENQRLQRENGALARTYAACEQMLRERTQQLNQVQQPE